MEVKMSGVYARIEIRKMDALHLKHLGVDVEHYSRDINCYWRGVEEWFNCQMEDGEGFLYDLEKHGYPVPLVGFHETESMHLSYIFVCPGDGTYHEIQCNEDMTPVAPVTWNGEYATPEISPAMVEYFRALAKFKEATR
jgi:hypothetical protein